MWGNMKSFITWIAENKTDDLFRLGFEESKVVGRAIAKRFAAHWQVELPEDIGQTVMCRPADEYRGSMTITKVSDLAWEVKHLNDATEPSRRKGYVFRPFG